MQTWTHHGMKGSTSPAQYATMHRENQIKEGDECLYVCLSLDAVLTSEETIVNDRNTASEVISSIKTSAPSLKIIQRASCSLSACTIHVLMVNLMLLN